MSIEVRNETHVDGIPWHDAPVPHRWHRCRAQSTYEVVVDGEPETVHRCPCGAIHFDDGACWIDRNTTRRRSTR